MGLPYREYFFCDGRVSVRAHQSSGGIDSIEYHGEQPLGYEVFFDSPPLHFKVDGERVGFEDIVIYPFGFENTFQADRKKYKFNMFIVGKVIVFEFQPVSAVTLVLPEKAGKKKINREGGKRIRKGPVFNKEISVLLFKVEDYDRVKRPPEERSLLHGGGISLPPLEMKGETHLAIFSSEKVRVKREKKSYHLTARGSKNSKKKQVLFAIAFGDSERELRDNIDLVRNSSYKLKRAQKKRYKDLSDTLPQFKIGEYIHLPRFFAVQPLYIESMRIPECGAIRAVNTKQWVWGWNMTQSMLGLLNCGWYEHVRQGLLFLFSTALENGKIGYQFSHTFEHYMVPKHGNAEDIYFLLLLARYYDYTKDLDFIKKVYPLAKKLFHEVAKRCNANGFYPVKGITIDWPEEFGRTKPAYVSYEMGIWYNACRGMEKLAFLLDDSEILEQIEGLSLHIKENFIPTFFNSKSGYLYESVEPDGKKHGFAYISSIGCMEGLYGEELLYPKLKEIAQFCEENFLAEYAIRTVPENEKRGDSHWTKPKSNWWFVCNLQLAKLFRRSNRGKALEKMLALYDQYFAWTYSIPEGYPFKNRSATGAFWFDMAGRSVYSLLIEAIAGLEVDIGGWTYIPCDMSIPIKIEGLSLRNSKWDVEIYGEGGWVEEINIDGKPLIGTFKIPVRYVEGGRHKLKINRARKKLSRPTLLEAIGAELLGVKSGIKKLEMNLSGTGRVPVKFYSHLKPKVILSGTDVRIEWAKQTGIGKAELCLRGESKLVISI